MQEIVAENLGRVFSHTSSLLCSHDIRRRAGKNLNGKIQANLLSSSVKIHHDKLKSWQPDWFTYANFKIFPQLSNFQQLWKILNIHKLF